MTLKLCAIVGITAKSNLVKERVHMLGKWKVPDQLRWCGVIINNLDQCYRSVRNPITRAVVFFKLRKPPLPFSGNSDIKQTAPGERGTFLWIICSLNSRTCLELAQHLSNDGSAQWMKACRSLVQHLPGSWPQLCVCSSTRHGHRCSAPTAANQIS